MVLLLCACLTSEDAHKTYLEKKDIPLTTAQSFSHCRGYGCQYIDHVDLSKRQWRLIKQVFRPRAKTAEKERLQIARAIGIFEQEVGALTGTKVDHYGTFKKLGTHQQDCVDESINTTIYLDLLKERDLLRFHNIQAPEVRLPLFHAGRWPHQTAVIADKETGERFAVDSWFHDNGFQAEVIAMDEWKRGWKPEKHMQNNQ